MKQITTVLQNVRTDLNNNINKNVRTFTSEGKKMIVYQLSIPELHYLKMPVLFRSLTSDQKQDVLSALLTLNTRMQQEILNEWAMICQRTDTIIRNPTGYLLRLISKAQQGYFRPNSGVNVCYITESELREEHKPMKTTEHPVIPKKLHN
ncbi:hypothetical protein [Zophobihabitans entericus]|uniref:Uncharacterized protein n=1 Tax=Zophobihabitans entericus TaxID=1635327 RepID=A0A6G9ID64_9GAMM|nr:hypothetical protein [Zophobihabitans entericus]QIQ22178.1 hypothetical protein IPMB12_11060 [Zophobihabitans entericus]